MGSDHGRSPMENLNSLTIHFMSKCEYEANIFLIPHLATKKMWENKRNKNFDA